MEEFVELGADAWGLGLGYGLFLVLCYFHDVHPISFANNYRVQPKETLSPDA